METPKITFIERTNSDKRKEKIIHPFDGRASPLDIGELESTIAGLVRMVDLTDFDYVLGFSEAGIIPAYAFARLSKKPLVCSYRTRTNLPNEIRFLEPHLRLPEHFIYALRKGDSVVIIDDEITSANTIVSAVMSLEETGVSVRAVGSIICRQLPEENELFFRTRGIPLYYLHKVDKPTK